MLTRRDFVRYGVLAGSGTMAALLAACGGRQSVAAPGGAMRGEGDQVRSVVSRVAGDPTLAADGAQVVRAFTADLYRRLSRSDGNLVCSPCSVAMALAMARTGARGMTAAEMDRVLHAPALQRLNGGLGAVDALLDKRSKKVRRADGSTAKVELHVANSLWGQRGVPWNSTFLDALARFYGTGMRLVDYRYDPEAARSRINAWTSAQTRGKIDQLIPEGVLTELTRLVLVDALYLKAPWEYPFEASGTEALPFIRTDGSAVTVATMRTEIHAGRHARGAGWEAAELRYAGNELGMTVILPDRGNLQALQDDLDGDRLAQILRSPAPVGALDLRLPKWTFRTTASLNESLIALGMPTAFDDRTADFGTMTSGEQLFISAVLHEAFIAVDEAGTEAAAATAVVMSDSAVGPAPVSMVVDRPFLFVIHDVRTATPLFIGRVTDPSA
jgi:serpin B